MDGLGSASPPVAPTATTGEGRHPLYPGHVPFGSSLSAPLACWISRRLSAVHLIFSHAIHLGPQPPYPSLDALSPEQLAALRRELDGKLATAATKQPAGSDLGSIGAMREDADFLDEIVEGAMKARREQPWRLSPGE